MLSNTFVNHHTWNIHAFFLGACVLNGCGGISPTQPSPESGPTEYRQIFEDRLSLDAMTFTDRNAWRWSDESNVPSLELYRASEYQPPHRSPHNIALLPVSRENFVLEADLMQTGREYGHRDLCLFFGYRDPSHFYYVHLATSPDQNAHNIFLVDDAPRRPLTDVSEEGVNWGQEEWHHVRLERRGKEIQVSFDGEVVLRAVDGTFPSGQLGLGSFDDTGRFANIRVE